MDLTADNETVLKFEQLLQFNPFHAAIVVNGQKQTVASMNDYAKTLLHKDRQLSELLQSTHWQALQQVANKGGEYRCHLSALGPCVIYAQALHNTPYVHLVIKPLHMQLQEIHTQFIAQHSEPFITVDYVGRIVYMNDAAHQKVKEANEHFMMWVNEASRMHVQSLLEQSLAGQPHLMTYCKMNTALFEEQAMTLQFFPAVLDGTVVGTHVLLKKELHIGDDTRALHEKLYKHELTGLLNRRALDEQWGSYEDTTSKMPMALYLVDIDRFKKFNEAIGKQKTDELLIKISERLSTLQTLACELFHYSGDEFIFIVQNVKEHELNAFAYTIQQLLQQPFVVEEQEYFVTASIGISSIQRGERLTIAKLLHKANQALDYVKKFERGQYRQYSDDIQLELSNEVVMETHLRRAIELNELTIHFQPQYNLTTEEVDSFEALVRWRNRKFGNVPPNVFIALAEASDLIIEIGDWILERVCMYIKAWREKGYRQMRVAVNISPKQFTHASFVEKVRTLLAYYQIEPHYLELEITEGSLMDSAVSTHILKELKALGVYVSVDDFGTGYSSLSYLKSYPIDIIKIDQSFIRDIEKDDKNEKIIQAIVLLSHTLGLEVIAEGVEKPSQEQFLRAIHCEKVQGYLYNRPVSAEEIEQKYLVYS